MIRARAAALPLSAAAALGALAALGQAPFGLWPVSLVANAGVMALVATAPGPRAAWWRGWLAGAAQFAVALVWIIEPFLVEPQRHGWMAPFALVLMAGGLGLFWGVPAWLATRATRARVARIWTFVVALLGFEALRGHLFTGFPWALSGHVWIGTPVDQLAALGGALMLSALSLCLAAALATAGLRWRQGRRLRAGAGLTMAALALAAGWGWGAHRLAEPAPTSPGVHLRLVQGNVPQHLKWQADLVEGFFMRHLELTARPADIPPDLVIWPESAVPILLDSPGPALRLMAEAAGVPVVFGIDRRELDAQGVARYFNALAVIDSQGAVTAVYDKHHLVPFGEYVPLIGALGQGWGGLAARVLSGYTPGPGPVALDLGAAGRVVPLICYEAVFARSLDGPPRPDWVLQITNDAWFGTWSGPYQHLAQARLRAIETGLPLVRAANTGVSTVIDARGRSLAALGLGEMGVLDVGLPGARAATPYTLWGDTPWHIALTLALLSLGWAGLRGRKRIDPGRRTR